MEFIVLSPKGEELGTVDADPDSDDLLAALIEGDYIDGDPEDYRIDSGADNLVLYVHDLERDTRVLVIETDDTDEDDADEDDDTELD